MYKGFSKILFLRVREYTYLGVNLGNLNISLTVSFGIPIHKHFKAPKLQPSHSLISPELLF